MLGKLKTLRETAGITQKQLAEAVGVSQQSINKYENHNIEPDIGTLIRIADYFDTSVDYIIGHSDVQRKAEPVTAYELNKEEQQIMDGFRKLSGKQKTCITAVIDSYMR